MQQGASFLKERGWGAMCMACGGWHGLSGSIILLHCNASLGFLSFTRDNSSSVGEFQASTKVGVLSGVPLSRTSGALSVC